MVSLVIFPIPVRIPEGGGALKRGVAYLGKIPFEHGIIRNPFYPADLPRSAEHIGTRINDPISRLRRMSATSMS